MKITEVCVNKPVLAWMMMAATIVFGIVAGTRIGVSQFPDVDFPTLSVNVSWPGRRPEVVENDIVETLEEALVQVEGLKSITSSSPPGRRLDHPGNRSVPGRRPGSAGRPVQGLPGRASLAPDIDPPTISKSNPEDQPIMMISLAGAVPPRVLTDYLQYSLKEKLQTIPGVGEIGADGRPGPQRPGLAGRDQAGREGPDRPRRHLRSPAGARRAPGRPARNAGPRSQRPGPGRGPRHRDAAAHRRPRSGRHPIYISDVAACRGRLRRHPPPGPGQRRSGPGLVGQEAARLERRRRGHSRPRRPGRFPEVPARGPATSASSSIRPCSSRSRSTRSNSRSCCRSF